MIGDHIKTTDEINAFAAKAVKYFLHRKVKTDIFFLSIAGESGSGKSTLAAAIKNVLRDIYDIPSIIIQMDDYFKLPPADNHNKRLSDLTHVGPHEVKLDLIDHHIEAIRRGAKSITKPLVDFHQNTIESEVINCEHAEVFIIEGTYVSQLHNLDYRIYIDRNYKLTLEDRKARAREEITPFIQSVLQIEHQIILQDKELADLVVNSNYSFSGKEIIDS